MTGQKSLSDFWRRDRSDDPARELASILQGADILLGNMGSDIQVTWAGNGVSYTDFQRRIVALDYGPLVGQECPFPGTAVDEVIGYAAHEGGHCLWSRPGADRTIQRHLLACWDSLPESLRLAWQADRHGVLAELCRVQNILEDAHIDRRVSCLWPVLAEYIRIARSRLEQRTPLDIEAIASAGCLDRNAVVNLWVWVALYGHQTPPHLSLRLERSLDSLLCLTGKAVLEGDAVTRQSMAVLAASILWQEFPEGRVALPDADRSLVPDVPPGGGPPGPGPRDDPPGGGARTLDGFDPSPADGGEGRRVVPVPAGIMDRVNQVLDRKEEDLSWSVARVVAEDPRRVATGARQADYDPELARKVSAQVQPEVQGIQQAFRQRQDLNCRWRHGLDRGKLDERRLWKPFTGDQRCYQRKEAIGTPSLTVGLLLDVSGSMSQHIPIVEQTAALFFQGLRHMPGVSFAAWAYSGESARAVLTRICDAQLPRLCLKNISQGGGTPSGAAIAAAGVLMERMAMRRKLLIHFTDGRPDSPEHVLRAVKACRDSGIRVYALGLPQQSRAFAGQYGEGNYQTIQAVEELPRAVARIVRQAGNSPP
ncbi:MAG: vWA domain-containing protein [Chloroflexota bacterium]